MSDGRGERWALAAVLLVAGGLRVAACAVWWDDLSRDPDAYRGLAARLAEGAGYVSPAGRPTAFRPPLYPLLLAAVGWAGPAGIATVQVVLGVATVGLTAPLGRRLGLGRWAWLAAVLVAVDPLLLRYTPQVMTEVTCAFLAALLLWAAAGRRQPFLLGVVFGLAVLSRPTFWAFGALATLTWGWELVCDRLGGLTPPARRAALAILGTALVVMPWAVRNEVVFGRPVVTTTHGGYTLLLANNPVFWREVVAGPPGAAWGGGSLDAWQRSLEREMAAEGVPPADELARDRWMRDRAMGYIRREPGMFVRSVVYRVRRLWGVAPAAGGVARGVSWGVAGFYCGVQVLALAGAGCVLFGRGGRFRGGAAPGAPDFRSQERDVGRGVPPAPGPSPQDAGGFATASWRPVLLLIAAFTAVHAVYWTDARMRAPLVPAVTVLAARGVACVRRGGVSRQKAGRT